MTKLTSLLLSIFIFSACTEPDRKSDKIGKTDSLIPIDSLKEKPYNEKIDTSFKLDFFESIPDTISGISGCVALCSYDSTERISDKYIFLANLRYFAIIKINGHDIYLNIDTSERKETSYGSIGVFKFKGSGYKAVLIIKTSGFESSSFKGTLEIVSDKVKKIFRVKGKSGFQNKKIIFKKCQN